MILLVYIAFLAALFLFTREYSEKIRTGLILGYNFLFVLLVQYIIRVFSMHDSAMTSVGNSLYNTVQSLTFNGDIDWAEKLTQRMQAQMWLIVFIAAVFTAESVLVAFFGRFLAQFKLKIRHLFAKEQYVIVGKPEEASILIADTLAHLDKPCVVYIPTQSPEEDSELYKICRMEEMSFLGRLKPEVKYHIVLLPEAEYSNLDAIYTLNERATDNDHVKLTAFLDNDVIRFHDIHADKLDTCLVSKEQLVVRKYFNECSPIDILCEANAFAKSGLPYLEKPFRLCVIGFGDMAKEFLLYSYENSAFITKERKSGFAALVMDTDYADKKEEFLTEAPYFETSDEIQFLHTKIGSASYFDAIKAYASEWKQILVATEDTGTNIKTAVKLCQFYNRLGIYQNRPQIVVMLNEDYSGARHLLEKYANIRLININREVINYATLIGRAEDEQAKEANDKYQKLNGCGTIWNKLGTFTVASNRALAFDTPIKRKLFKLSHASKKQTMEFLAEYEHARWNAFHHARGWRKMPVSDLTPDELTNCKTKHPDEKRHICLVSWDEIDALPQKTPGLLKAYDMENVMQALGEEKNNKGFFNKIQSLM